MHVPVEATQFRAFIAAIVVAKNIIQWKALNRIEKSEIVWKNTLEACET